MSIFKAAVAAALAAAIAAAAYAVYSNWEPISEFFSELCGKIGAGFSAAWAGIRDGFAAALNFVRSGVDWLRSLRQPLRRRRPHRVMPLPFPRFPPRISNR